MDDKTGLGCRGAKKVEHGLVALERLASPVLADLTEEAMLDGVPLGGAGGVVADGDGEPEAIAEAGL